MTPWQWFTFHGDDLFLFLTFVALEAQREAIFPAPVMKYIIFIGAVATIAHKVFFPNPTQPPSAANSLGAKQ